MWGIWNGSLQEWDETLKQKLWKTPNWKQFNHWHQSWWRQLMDWGREKSRMRKLWGLGSVGGEWVRNLLYSLLWLPLQEVRALQVKKSSMQAEFYVNYKTPLLLTLPLRVTIRLFLHNTTSLLFQKISFFIKVVLLFSCIFPRHEPGSFNCLLREPYLTPINHSLQKAFLFLHLSRQPEPTAIKKAWVQQIYKVRG